MSRPLGALCGLVLGALAVFCSPSAIGQAQDVPVTHPFAGSRPIAGHYIVVFDSAVVNPAAEAAAVVGAAGPGAQLHHVYGTALKGFAATLPDSALAGLRNNPRIQSIEQDQTVSLSLMEEQNAPWGLDRIDQRTRPLDTMYYYNGTGSGVTAFIIDTGIRADHEDLVGRVTSGYTAINDGRGTNDCNGHGTHVSGTVAGTTWGVAKGASLVAVRVLDCRGSGTWSGVIAGVDYVASTGSRPAVANMSLGGGKSSSVNQAVAGAVASGVTMVVAAGNSTADACNYSPASEPSAITVGATTSGDARASYSNFGSCVDIFAPGSSITSAWYTSSTATNTISGTSMASPHVAGAAALAAQANTGATPAAITSFLISNATPGQLGSVGTGSPNLLLYSLASGTATEPVQPVIGVTNLTGTATTSRNGRSWRAIVTATVQDTQSAPMANATVTGSFDSGGTASCVTAADGRCTLTSSSISTKVPMTVFNVVSVSGNNMVAGTNTASEIRIDRP